MSIKWYSRYYTFLSGAIGYISYDAGRLLEELPNTSKEDFNIPWYEIYFY